MNGGNLQRELKKRQPFDSVEQEAMLNLWRTADRFQTRFGRLFRQFGITASQYNVLRILRGEGIPLPSLEIAGRMIQEVPAITGLIDRLERQELVSRHRCDNDRRVVFVEITPKARELLARMDEPVMELHRGLVGHLTSDELSQLTALLEKARQSVAQPGAGDAAESDGQA